MPTRINHLSTPSTGPSSFSISEIASKITGARSKVFPNKKAKNKNELIVFQLLALKPKVCVAGGVGVVEQKGNGNIFH